MNTINIAFIGFGEVGQTFARGLLMREEVRVRAYDILFGKQEGATLAEAAHRMGAVIAADAFSASNGASVVISAVTASEAEKVARDASAFLRPGQIFLDINSAAPSTKQRAAQHIEASGASYVEGAVMAPVMKPGLKVPILSGGSASPELVEMLNALGMNLTHVAVSIGKASAMKLCRSIMIKGIEALMLDCAAASEAQGVKDEVFASLGATFPSIDWLGLSENMRERVATHGVRRSAEMREAGEMLAEIGIEPGLANAVAEAQLRGARNKAAS